MYEADKFGEFLCGSKERKLKIKSRNNFVPSHSLTKLCVLVEDQHFTAINFCEDCFFQSSSKILQKLIL